MNQSDIIFEFNTYLNTTFNTINDFNTFLINNKRNINLKDYIKEIHSKFYPELDISFQDYLSELKEHKNEFIVDYNKLYKYGVINTTKNIKKSLKKLFLIENEDYIIINNEYKLTPNSFKICLMRSENTTKYVEYFLFIEKVYYNYNLYQMMKINSL
jgi:hypothetical protein